MKRWLPGIACATLLSFVLTDIGCTAENTTVKEAGPADELPNIILIVSDDQGYADVSYHGSTEIPTPNIDRIANGGAYFTEGYVTYPICGPSRAGLLTGRYQDRFGFTYNPTIDPSVPSAGLPVEEDMISELLKTVGYTSMAVGKWHMGMREEYHPLNRGFDSFFGFLSGGHRYFPEELTLNSIEDVTERWGWYKTRLLKDRERVDIDQYLTDELSDRAVEFVGRQSEPFFLYLAYNAPHGPLQATQKYLDRFQHIEDEKRRTYAAMVSSMDDGIGAVLDKLDERGIADNTLVFFLSDNGGPESHNGSNNGVLRGGKGDLFEGGIRVPFAMRWPKMLKAGQVYEEPVSSLDILGTVAAVTGVEISTERPLDGVNLVPFLTGRAKGRPHERLFWRKFEDAYAVRDGDTKLIAEIEESEARVFQLDQDIREDRALSPAQSQQADALREAYDAWESEMKGPAFPKLGNWNPRTDPRRPEQP